MEKEMLSLTKIDNRDHASCNCCGAPNYDATYTKAEKVDTLYELRIGIMVNRICRKCLRKIEQLAGAEMRTSNE